MRGSSPKSPTMTPGSSMARANSWTRSVRSKRFAFRLPPIAGRKRDFARHALLLRQQHLIHEIVTAVASIDALEVARSYAQSLYALAGDETDTVLLEATALLPAEIRDAFRRPTSDALVCSYADVIEALRPPDEVLRRARRRPRPARLGARGFGPCGGRSCKNPRAGRRALAARQGVFAVPRGLARDGAPGPAPGLDRHHGGTSFGRGLRGAGSTVVGQPR